MKPELLTAEAIAAGLASLPGWESDGHRLHKTFRFPSYLAGIDFVRAVAAEAEAMNHHPDLQVGWRRVDAALSTHSAGGVTALDVELARRIERCLG